MGIYIYICTNDPCMVYFPTFTIQINQMWVNIPYRDLMGYIYMYNKKTWVTSEDFPLVFLFFFRARQQGTELLTRDFHDFLMVFEIYLYISHDFLIISEGSRCVLYSREGYGSLGICICIFV